jgi:hypothetical protein
VFEENDTAYLVMEHLDGRTLAELLAERGAPLTESEALDVALRCGRALVEVHEAGILHRDLNPSNVMVTGTGRVVLIDFGLAQSFDEKTGAMTRMVTPGYAPPEQYVGSARFGPPTDVYGLAATLYRLVSGRPPVSALDRQQGAVLVSPHRLNPAVSPVVGQAILDGMELRAAHRPQSMPVFLARLGLGGAVLPARSPLAWSRDRRREAEEPPVDRDATRASGTRLQPTELRGDFVEPRPAPPAAEPKPVRPGDRYRRPGFWKVGVPGLVALAALGAAAPIATNAFLALVALPVMATAGDAVVFVRLRREGGRLRWLHRASLPPYLPARYIRNLGAVFERGVAGILVAAGGFGLALLLEASGAPPGSRDAILRCCGIAAAFLLVLPILRDRTRFRAALVGDAATRRLLRSDGSLTRAGLVAWVLAGLVALLGFGLHPDVWPF